MRGFLAAVGLVAASSATAQGFHHEHAAWTALLMKHVVLLEGAKGSQVRYAGFQQDRAALKSHLDAQLEEQARRLLSDRSRNRYNPESGRLEVSKIFDRKAELRFLEYDWALNDIKR